MKYFTVLVLVGLMLGLITTSEAKNFPVRTSNPNPMIHGGSHIPSKAAGDTIQVMGPGGLYRGDFENSTGGALCDGWTSVDLTQPTVTHWSLATVNNDVTGITGTSAWCGEYITACSAEDSTWGYGNSWHDLLEWRASVVDINVSTTVTVTGNLFYDNEPGYDYAYLSYMVAGQFGYIDQASWNGRPDPAAAVAVNETITYLPGEYVDFNQVVILFRFESDSGWSDSDCSWPTRGAMNIDNVAVGLVNGSYTHGTYDDFESGWGHWAVTYPQGVGDFAKVWSGLQDLDPCRFNFSKQVAFIDDGIVVPGTGGSQCINWCYGPNGYIVNTTGGLAGPYSRIHNAIESPVMDWPDGTYDGIIYSFDVFRHEDLTVDAPNIFYTWSIRSANTKAGQDITTQPWLHRNFVYYGDPRYIRVSNDVTDLMVPDRDEVQLRTAVYQYSFFFEVGDDGYPAPYFDNFNVKVFPYDGPALAAYEIHLAQDNFPAVGTVDMSDPSALSVRFDMARNISPYRDLRDDPGDSIVVSITPVRASSVMYGTPTLHWALNPNPTFEAYRTSIYAAATSGVSAGRLDGENLWSFDLPDTAFLFPGDILHYYVAASDEVGGDIQTATIPADLTGYGDFSHPLAFDSSFVVHCLPTIIADGYGHYTQPRILFLNDFANGGGEAEWYGALDNLGGIAGMDFDIYYTNGPSSGVGNGIGGRATALQLSDYSDILYTCGDLARYTISNGSFNADAGNDVGILTQWLDQGGKDIFLTGDNLANDLNTSGVETQTFLNTYLGLDITDSDIRPLISNQTTPMVNSMPGNGVIVNQSSWIAYGGCEGINTFDAVTTRGSATRLAEFTDPAGDTGAYPYSAATLNTLGNGSRAVSMPYDFMSIYNDPGTAKSQAPLSARVQILRDIISFFGFAGPPEHSPVPEANRFTARAYPNPFNPTTKIKFNIPVQSMVTVKIFNLSGELIRTLLEGVSPAGNNSVLWDGTSSGGATVASGLYFYQVRYLNEVKVGKITMVK